MRQGSSVGKERRSHKPKVAGSKPAPGTTMKSQRHTDPEHHSHGARGLVVGPPTVHRKTPGSIPAAYPKTEMFTQPGRAICMVGLERGYPSVAEAVCKRTVEARETLVRLQPEGLMTRITF